MSSFAVRIGIAVAAGGLAVVAASPASAIATASVPTSAAIASSAPSTGPSGDPSGGGLTVGLGGLTVSVGGGTVTVGPVTVPVPVSVPVKVPVNVPGTIAGVGSTLKKTLKQTLGGSAGQGSSKSGGGGRTTPPPHHTPTSPGTPHHPVRHHRGTHTEPGTTRRSHTSHARPAGASRHRAGTGTVRSEPRDTISSPLSKTHLRLARPVVAQHRIARLAARAFGPEALRPGRTVLMLLASTTVLAILVLGLLVFVGRRPDPRVAASEHRLRTGATW